MNPISIFKNSKLFVLFLPESNGSVSPILEFISLKDAKEYAHKYFPKRRFIIKEYSGDRLDEWFEFKNRMKLNEKL